MHTVDGCIKDNWGFGILPVDTLTCKVEQPGIKPFALQLVDDPPYLLSHNIPKFLVNLCL